MAKVKHVHAGGFLGTGLVSHTFLAKLPAMADFLGPVFTPTRRATPRVVTAIGAGFSVPTMEEMRGCQHLIVCANPEETVCLLASALECGVLQGVDTLALVENASLAQPSAEVVSSVREVGCLSALPNRKQATYLVEGSLRFRRFCQSLLDVPIGRMVVIPRDARVMVDAGIFLAEEFCLPLLEATQSAFMAAGIGRDQARELGAELLRESIENARFAGRKRWTGILHTRDGRRLGEIVHALHAENELLANLALGFSREGLAMMGKDAGWIANLPASENGYVRENGRPRRRGRVGSLVQQ